MPAKPQADPRPRLQGLRLLLVEDDAILRQMTRALLGDEGAEVLLAANGQEGVDMVLATLGEGGLRFDAVLMDVQMPVMDGFDATRAMRKHFDHAVLPIMAMTGNASATDVQACMAAGMNDLVGKPVDLDQLVRCVIHHVLPLADPTQPTPAGRLGADIEEDMRLALSRMGGNLNIFLGVLESFQQNLERVPGRLEMLLKPAVPAALPPLAEAASEMHSLKGIALTLGLNELASRAAAAEQALRQAGPTLDRAALLADIQAAIRQGLQDIAAMLPRLRPVSAG